MLHFDRNNARAHYRTLELQSKIENAEPFGLVTLLYDELLLCLDVLIVRSRDASSLVADEQALRARSIIISLRSGLDIDSGGELALMLDGLYAALSTDLERHLLQPEPLRFAELKTGVQSISLAWSGITGK